MLFRSKKFIARTKSVKHIAMHPNFTKILVQVCGSSDKNLKDKLGQVENFDSTFAFNLSESYCVVVPSQIPFVQKIITLFKQSVAKPTVDICLYPYMTASVAAYIEENMGASKAKNVLFGENNETKSKYEDKASISYSDFGIEILSLDKDLVTMLSPGVIPRLWSMNDLTVFSEIRSSLHKIFLRYGVPSGITSIGSNAKSFLDKIENICPESNNYQLIIFDRNVDFISPDRKSVV